MVCIQLNRDHESVCITTNAPEEAMNSLQRPDRRTLGRDARAALAAGICFAWCGEAAADIFCAQGTRPALVLRHIARVADGEAARTATRRLPPNRASCTTCHIAPGPESLLGPNTPPLWPFTAYGLALTTLRPGLTPAGLLDDAATDDAFIRVDRLPVDPGDPAWLTYGDRIRQGLPPQPLAPAGDDEPPAVPGPRVPRQLGFKEALEMVILDRGAPILQASEVSEIDARVAGALARFDGRFLILGLRSLPADVAGQLAEAKADTVWLHSLTAILPEAAAVLAASRGNLIMSGLCRLESAELAAKIASRPGPLSLPFLQQISVEAARALVDRDERVCLAALADAATDVQEALAAGRCRVDLPALRRLESPALARKLAASPVVYLGGLEVLTEEVVTILLEPVANRRGVVLPLAALTPEVLEAMSANGDGLGVLMVTGRDLSADGLRAIAAVAAKKTIFPDVTELPADVQAVAAETRVFFPNLRTLDSTALAASFFNRDGDRILDAFKLLSAVQSITPEVALEIARFRPVEGLRMDSLRRLPPEVAKPLLETPRSFMTLSGLEEISTDTLRLLLERIRNDGSSASLVLGVSRLPPGPFAPPAGARGKTNRFDLKLPALATLSADDARNLVAFMRPKNDILSITVPELSPEAAAVFAEWGGQFNLSGLESLSPEVARALARLPGGRGYVGVINLPKIKTPDRNSLAELAKAKRPFSFGGISELTSDLARALVNCPTCSLRFPAVTSITPEVARVLVSGTGRALQLPGLTAVDPETAALLAARPGWDPYLPDVRTLSPESAAALAGFVSTFGDLRLFGLTSLEPGVAAALAQCQRCVTVFPAVKAIEPEAVAAFADCKRPFGLPGLTSLTPDVAAALAACPTWNGGLPSITGFEAPDSVAVAAALARKQGPLSLPNLNKISPKTLTTLIGKPDVEVPRIETLTLIAEPDGGPTEDFVIPAEFQKRQQQRPR